MSTVAKLLHVEDEDFDQTVHMHGLSSVFTGGICQKERFMTLSLILLMVLTHNCVNGHFLWLGHFFTKNT